MVKLFRILSAGSVNNFTRFFRQELLVEREKHKEEQVEALKRSMQTGMVSDFSLWK